MPIGHEDTCVPDTNPIQCAMYNKDHKITNMLGYELVEEKELPAGTTTCSFNNLNGDEDKEYLFEFDISIVSGGTNRLINVLPNNVSTGQQTISFLNYGNSGGNETKTSLLLAASDWNENGDSWGTLKINAATGKRRKILGKSHFIPVSTDNNGIRFNYGKWADAVSVITSLVLLISGGSFSGNIKLWKRIPLDGGI